MELQLKLKIVQKTSSNTGSIITFSVIVVGQQIGFH